MSRRKTLKVSRKRTSSQALAAGRKRSGLQVGRIAGRCGRAVARANLSPRQAKEKGLLTSGTFGPPGTGSSRSVALQLSLESKLRMQFDTVGLILFRVTWKEAVTPSRRRYLQQVVSALPTSESVCGSWPTPTTPSGGQTWPKGTTATGIRPDGTKATVNLTNIALLAVWPTPRAADSEGGPEPDGKTGRKLATVAHWATPQARDYFPAHSQEYIRIKKAEGHGMGNLNDQVQLVHPGSTATGSTAPTENGGQLNPAHSRWLMGYPRAWDDCGVMAMQSCRKSRRNSLEE